MSSRPSPEGERSPESAETRRAGEGTRSLGAITSDLTSDLSELVRGEMALAKAEMREEAKTAAKGGVVLLGAAMLAMLTLMLLAMAVGFLIANLGGDPPALALGFFLAGVAFAIPAAIAGLLARKRLQKVEPVPRRTLDSVSADVQAVKERRA